MYSVPTYTVYVGNLALRTSEDHSLLWHRFGVKPVKLEGSTCGNSILECSGGGITFYGVVHSESSEVANENQHLQHRGSTIQL
jgi:hypothetical protein